MTRLTWEPLTLKLRNPFRLSYGTSETRQAYWIRLAGDAGWGEGTIPPYYGVDASEMTACWERAAAQDRPPPDEAEDVARWIPPGPAPARSALELALLDRIAKQRNVPLHRLLGLPPPKVLPTSFTIAIDAPEAMADMATQIRDYPVIKIKLGGDAEDEARVRAVRAARPDAALRVDANAGWTLDGAADHLRWLEECGVELIEQPLPRDAIESMGQVQRRTSIPIVADESVQTIEDVELLGRAGVRGINLKIMKVGGLTPALAMLRRASEMSMHVMLGCMIETSIGTTAMAHLAGLADWIDLDAPLLISNDPFAGITYDRNARVSVPDRPGIGVVRREDVRA